MKIKFEPDNPRHETLESTLISTLRAEVESLRTECARLESERDGYAAKNRALRKLVGRLTFETVGELPEV